MQGQGGKKEDRGALQQTNKLHPPPSDTSFTCFLYFFRLLSLHQTAQQLMRCGWHHTALCTLRVWQTKQENYVLCLFYSFIYSFIYMLKCFKEQASRKKGSDGHISFLSLHFSNIIGSSTQQMRAQLWDYLVLNRLSKCYKW